jgi:hypothetical protein
MGAKGLNSFVLMLVMDTGVDVVYDRVGCIASQIQMVRDPYREPFSNYLHRPRRRHTHSVGLKTSIQASSHRLIDSKRKDVIPTNPESIDRQGMMVYCTTVVIQRSSYIAPKGTHVHGEVAAPARKQISESSSTCRAETYAI